MYTVKTEEFIIDSEYKLRLILDPRKTVRAAQKRLAKEIIPSAEEIVSRTIDRYETNPNAYIGEIDKPCIATLEFCVDAAKYSKKERKTKDLNRGTNSHNIDICMSNLVKAKRGIEMNNRKVEEAGDPVLVWLEDEHRYITTRDIFVKDFKSDSEFDKSNGRTAVCKIKKGTKSGVFDDKDCMSIKPLKVKKEKLFIEEELNIEDGEKLEVYQWLDEKSKICNGGLIAPAHSPFEFCNIRNSLVDGPVVLLSSTIISSEISCTKPSRISTNNRIRDSKIEADKISITNHICLDGVRIKAKTAKLDTYVKATSSSFTTKENLILTNTSTYIDFHIDNGFYGICLIYCTFVSNIYKIRIENFSEPLTRLGLVIQTENI